jgi:ZIP family zinc transporter
VPFGETILLGALAGATILLGLPLARVRVVRPALRVGTNAVAVGILVFILVDVSQSAIGTVTAALDRAAHHGASWWPGAGLSGLFAAATALGCVGLALVERLLARQVPRPAGPGPSVAPVGVVPPSTASVDGEPAADPSGGVANQVANPAASTAESIREAPRRTGAFRSPARQLALMVAIGIGLHNLGEGLAIGQSAARHAVTLALVLVIGFGLHNATEGFGVAGPLAAAGERPPLRTLAGLGAIAGGPTFVGTVLGRIASSDAASVGFLALAAGSILYVVLQLVTVLARQGHRELLLAGVVVGFLVGVATDTVLSVAGV